MCLFWCILLFSVAFRTLNATREFELVGKIEEDYVSTLQSASFDCLLEGGSSTQTAEALTLTHSAVKDYTSILLGNAQIWDTKKIDTSGKIENVKFDREHRFFSLFANNRVSIQSFAPINSQSNTWFDEFVLRSNDGLQLDCKRRTDEESTDRNKLLNQFSSSNTSSGRQQDSFSEPQPETQANNSSNPFPSSSMQPSDLSESPLPSDTPSNSPVPTFTFAPSFQVTGTTRPTSITTRTQSPGPTDGATESHPPSLSMIPTAPSRSPAPTLTEEFNQGSDDEQERLSTLSTSPMPTQTVSPTLLVINLAPLPSDTLMPSLSSMPSLVSVLTTTQLNSSADSVQYEVFFESSWSVDHSIGFLEEATLGNQTIAVHSKEYAIWTLGENATEGVQQVAEESNSISLVQGLINLTETEPVLIGDLLESREIPLTSTAEVSLGVISTTKEFPQISIISKLEPSFDWFTGISNISLLDESGSSWLDEIEISAFPTDAGTINETNQSSSSHPITELTLDMLPNEFQEYSFEGSVMPIGTFRIRLHPSNTSFPSISTSPSASPVPSSFLNEFPSFSRLPSTVQSTVPSTSPNLTISSYPSQIPTKSPAPSFTPSPTNTGEPSSAPSGTLVRPTQSTDPTLTFGPSPLPSLSGIPTVWIRGESDDDLFPKPVAPVASVPLDFPLELDGSEGDKSDTNYTNSTTDENDDDEMDDSGSSRIRCMLTMWTFIQIVVFLMV